jgi:hypothetical protein
MPPTSLIRADDMNKELPDGNYWHFTDVPAH